MTQEPSRRQSSLKGALGGRERAKATQEQDGIPMPPRPDHLDLESIRRYLAEYRANGGKPLRCATPEEEEEIRRREADDATTTPTSAVIGATRRPSRDDQPGTEPGDSEEPSKEPSTRGPRRRVIGGS
jgi:hypothetical protein